MPISILIAAVCVSVFITILAIGSIIAATKNSKKITWVQTLLTKRMDELVSSKVDTGRVQEQNAEQNNTQDGYHI